MINRFIQFIQFMRDESYSRMDLRAEQFLSFLLRTDGISD